MNYKFDPRCGCCGGHGPQLGDMFLTRRRFLARCGMGFGALSLAGLTGMGLLPGGRADAAEAIAGPLAPKKPHFPGKAKRVLHIFAAGAPSQLDTWDPKPDLARFDGQSMPDDANGTAFASPFTFQKMGKSGIEVSEVFPLLGAQVDKLAVVRSMQTEIPDHDTATVMMNTGNTRLIRPSVGSWVTYGLGTENQNMPGFIALGPGGVQARYIRSAFLPGVYQGTAVNTQHVEVEKLIENIKNNYTSQQEQRRQLDLLNQLNEEHSQNMRKDAELEARLQAFEMAYQMQMEATDAFDISKETEAVRQAYAANTQQGRQLLIARRLLERGVRFVQVWHSGWDHHSNLGTDLPAKAAECDKPIAALLTDMAQSGLLNDTLILWGGEFGRSATADGNAMGRSPGRNHNHRAFSVWLAGGGIRHGVVYGKTDELGVRAVQDPVSIHDLHATILHVLGFDHEKLTFRYSGRDFRLTEVYGNVVKGIVT
jgi:hypothetical protein